MAAKIAAHVLNDALDAGDLSERSLASYQRGWPAAVRYDGDCIEARTVSRAEYERVTHQASSAE